MKYSIRIDRANPSALHIQAVRYFKRKPIVLKHIGTAHTEEEKNELLFLARKWIADNPPQQTLFQPGKERARPSLDESEYRGVTHRFIYELLYRLCSRFHFTSLKNRIFIDLVIQRIVEPASKLRSLALLERFFRISYDKNALYRALPQIAMKKEVVERLLVELARKEFGFDFTFVLYDVTTLYFETFKDDELRKPGFSKDNKPQQPQIVIGVMVTPEGFPVSYEVFAGNIFEGNTFLPSILAFKKRHDIKTLTVVADAAMLSLDNIAALGKHGLTYIVGARLGNVSEKLYERILSLPRIDQATARHMTAHGDLLVEYSEKRSRKDLHEVDKQIAKAKSIVEKPGKAKRAKFLLGVNAGFSLNEPLIKKAKSLAGIKGFYTNLTGVDDAYIINHYRSLWRIEQAFRIAKTDLATRPVFHRKDASIRAHIVICVMALAISKYIELKTKISIKRFVWLCMGVTDALFIHTDTNTLRTIRSPVSPEVQTIQKDLQH